MAAQGNGLGDGGKGEISALKGRHKIVLVQPCGGDRSWAARLRSVCIQASKSVA